MRREQASSAGAGVALSADLERTNFSRASRCPNIERMSSVPSRSGAAAINDDTGPLASLRIADVASIAAAIASPDLPTSLLKAIERIATARIAVSIFSASRCFLDTVELERIYSSRPDVYPVGMRKSKRQTNWARYVLEDRQVFVGEGPLEMAAAFDDQERMASLGIRSIINAGRRP